jgi:CDP-2,3-bis-(O-geranylgeranyl)-sn-glycerol synthase
VVLGILLTLGAQAGDLLGSFVKRRLGIARGDRALLLDQLLFLALALALAALHFLPPWEEIAFLAVLTLVLHPASNYVAYLFHLKRVPW